MTLEYKKLGSGGYGCVFTPSVPCPGEKVDDNMVTKVQFSDKASKREEDMAKIIKKKVSAYKEYFVIVDSSCDVSKKDIPKNIIKDCEPIQDFSAPLSLLQMDYVRHQAFGKLPASGEPEAIYKLFESTIVALPHLVTGLKKLSEVGIVHFDIKADNVLQRPIPLPPLIADFGLAFMPEKITSFEDLKLYLFTYAPYYAMIWPPEIQFLTFVVYKIGPVNEITDDQVVEVAREVANNIPEYIFGKDAFFELYKYYSSLADIYNEQDIVSVERLAALIYKVFEHSNKIDTYAMSTMYIKMFDSMFAGALKEPKIYDDLRSVFSLGCAIDPSKRITGTKLVQNVAKLFDSPVIIPRLKTVTLMSALSIDKARSSQKDKRVAEAKADIKMQKAFYEKSPVKTRKQITSRKSQATRRKKAPTPPQLSIVSRKSPSPLSDVPYVISMLSDTDLDKQLKRYKIYQSVTKGSRPSLERRLYKKITREIIKQ